MGCVIVAHGLLVHTYTLVRKYTAVCLPVSHVHGGWQNVRHVDERVVTRVAWYGWPCIMWIKLAITGGVHDLQNASRAFLAAIGTRRIELRSQNLRAGGGGTLLREKCMQCACNPNSQYP